ncbi:hypothetical protein ACQQ2N_14455 [Dokdonella sp. MW10]
MTAPTWSALPARRNALDPGYAGTLRPQGRDSRSTDPVFRNALE